jgi:hypothetical protein
MRPQFPLSLLLATLLALPAWAQDAGRPLNLKLPPSDLPAAASTAPQPSHAPGVYYGDHSGRTAAADEATVVPDCDDATYNQPQVHGSVGMGVMSGSHVDGSYQQGTVNLSKAFGSCDHPTGGVSVSIGAGSGHVHGRGH